MSNPTAQSSEQHRLLGIYLRDHQAAVAGGVRLAQRACSSHRGGATGDLLRSVETGLRADHASLEELVADLGFRSRRTKPAIAVIAEWFGRCKLNGHLWRRSPLSDVVELEALYAVVVANRLLWQTVAAIRATGPDPDTSSGMIERCDEQLARLRAHHDGVAGHVFTSAYDSHSDAFWRATN